MKFATYATSVAIFFLVMSSAVAADESSDLSSQEKPTANELMQMVQTLIEKNVHTHHHHRHRRVCGTNAIRRLETACPDDCSVHDDTLVHDICRKRLSDEELVQRCCP